MPTEGTARPGHSDPPNSFQSAHIFTRLESLHMHPRLQVIHYLTLTSGDDTDAYRGHGTHISGSAVDAIVLFKVLTSWWYVSISLESPHLLYYCR